MKKIIIVLLICFIAVGLIFGCTETTPNTIDNSNSGNVVTQPDNTNDNLNNNSTHLGKEVCHLFNLEEIRLVLGVNDIQERSTTVVKSNPNNSKYWNCSLESQTNNNYKFFISLQDFKDAIESEDYHYNPSLSFNEMKELECLNSEFYDVEYCEEGIIGDSYWTEFKNSFGDNKLLVAVVGDLVVSVKVQGELDRSEGIQAAKAIINLLS